ncbi:MATH [Macleaya cordata]|uniref:MATH n=1 Tax=Macleaya cordata TaxID=56857 RepID=A0A200QSY2_MACCD|nr:MATH [Macleaya cordata]
MEKVTGFFKEKLKLDGIGKSSYRSPILCSGASSAILPQRGPKRCKRDDPPTHYSFKIKSYSLIQKFERHISPVFEEGGFKWNLCFYPNGKKNEGGEGHISIYLRIADTDYLSPGWKVKAFFRLLLLDQISGKYLTLGDTHERCFHAMNKEQGFARFIRLKTFLNTERGYLIDDACKIGAEVFVVRYNGKGDCFERISGKNTCTHAWKIPNFSKREKTFYYSKAFTVGRHEWKIKLYPKGNGRVEGNNLSLFLELTNSSNLCPGEQVYVDYNLCIKARQKTIYIAENLIRSYGFCIAAQSWFSASRQLWGCQKFISLHKLNDPEQGYLVEDRCIIEAEVNVLGHTRP